MFDLAITGNNIITPDGMGKAAVLIRDGRITDVAPALPAAAVARIIDIQDLVLMPGITDPHVHINEPGRTEWEGFETATRAAIAGGVTTLVDMPLNASPVTTTVAAFEEKLRVAERQLHAHCGFWGGVVPGNENEVPGLIAAGVLGFKAFLTHSGINEFPNVTSADLDKVMPLLAMHQLPLLVHCELSTRRAPLLNGYSRSYAHYLASRPHQWEDEAIALVIQLCEQYRSPVHIVHLSSAASVAQIRDAKKRGLPVTAETAQHYLYFNAEDIADGQTLLKCAPPIREKANNEQLWAALQEGVIDFVATDHSPATPALKEMDSGDFLRAWGGIASLQLALPALWTAARKRDIPLTAMARWLCEAPPRLPGLQQRKGKIAPGYDADLVAWDPEAAFTVTPESLHHKHKITPYLHETLYGVVKQTWLAGQLVYNNGAFPLSHTGQIIKR
ncbi:allantoinase AllB [Chitinophaga japonensis]|uniref:allantoinase n=1 Tax=Chitinophaga japonensis TaxID=104662 RepID=A0A562T4I6_CHIJA|nr:allantoinase AllB [Chitinophaga japonensis]TWI87920.1 allantoinase [Chitinophaga japonensis]